MLAALAEPELGFAHYLLGLQYVNASDWRAATVELGRALELGLPGPAFVENGARRLALAAYRSGDAIAVHAAMDALAAPAMSTADHLLAADWAERLTFR